MNLSNARFTQTSFTRNHFHASIPSEVSFEEILSPDYWCNNAVQLKIGDHIEAFCEDGSFYAEMIVRNCDRLTAVLGVITHVDFSGSVEIDEIDPEYEVAFAGPTHKWRIVRKSDKAVVKHGFQTKQEAHTELSSYIKALAA